MEFFIGLAFNNSSIHHNKIENFRRRYDSKFHKGQVLQLTMLPPFVYEYKNQEALFSLKEELSDTLDTHFLGINQTPQIEFNGITFSMGKKGILSLTPKISLDLFHCQESIMELLKDSGAKFKKNKNVTNPILPIGRFDFSDQLESAIEMAKIEFSSPFVMDVESVILFEKTPKIWIPKFSLYEFKRENHFFFVNG